MKKRSPRVEQEIRSTARDDDIVRPMQVMDRAPSSSWALTKRLFPFVWQHKPVLVVSVVAAVLSAALAQVDPLVLRYVVDQVTKPNASVDTSTFALLATAGSILLVKQLMLMLTQFIQSYSGERLKTAVTADLTSFAAKRLLRTSMSVLAMPGNDTPRLTQRVDRASDALGKSTKNLFADILPLLGTSVVSLVVMFSVNAWVGAAATCIVPIYFALSWDQARRQRGVRVALQNDREDLAANVANSLSNAVVVKSFVREGFESDRIENSANRLARKSLNHHRINRVYDTLKSGAESIGASVIVLVTAYLILEGRMSAGAIPLHLLLFRNVTAPIRELHRLYDEHNEALALSEQFFKTMDDAAPEQQIVDQPARIKAPPSVRLESVTFRYPGADRPALHDVSIELSPGRITALVGLSGAGKTTLANLLSKFYTPESGRIMWNETSYETLAASELRENVAVVTQFPYIFPGSIKSNIEYGTRDENVVQFERAVQDSGLKRLLQTTTGGLQRDAGLLSGGERQRVAIARAFLKDAPVLVLDEPTASLDAVNALEIQRAIERLAEGRTVLVISHNLALIRAADYLYILREGEIVQAGTHEDLVREQGHYREIISSHAAALRIPELIDGG